MCHWFYEDWILWLFSSKRFSTHVLLPIVCYGRADSLFWQRMQCQMIARVYSNLWQQWEHLFWKIEWQVTIRTNRNTSNQLGFSSAQTDRCLSHFIPTPSCSDIKSEWFITWMVCFQDLQWNLHSTTNDHQSKNAVLYTAVARILLFKD